MFINTWTIKYRYLTIISYNTDFLSARSFRSRFLNFKQSIQQWWFPNRSDTNEDNRFTFQKLKFLWLKLFPKNVLDFFIDLFDLRGIIKFFQILLQRFYLILSLFGFSQQYLLTSLILSIVFLILLNNFASVFFFRFDLLSHLIHILLLISDLPCELSISSLLISTVNLSLLFKISSR